MDRQWVAGSNRQLGELTNDHWMKPHPAADILAAVHSAIDPQAQLHGRRACGGRDRRDDHVAGLGAADRRPSGSANRPAVGVEVDQFNPCGGRAAAPMVSTRVVNRYW